MRTVGLTKKYICLQRIQKASYGERALNYENEIEKLFRKIVQMEIKSANDIIDKIHFSYHCLTEEEDIEQAAQLIRQICLALDRAVVATLLDDLLAGPLQPRRGRLVRLRSGATHVSRPHATIGSNPLPGQGGDVHAADPPG